jgi:hypothetical protein
VDGNHSPSEENSWDQSLPAMASVLFDAGLSSHYLGIEVPMPGTSCRADIVILGRGADGARTVAVVELKHWRQCEAGAADLVRLGDKPHLHPCSQVEGYRDYLAMYGSAWVDRQPESRVVGCAYLHRMADISPLAVGSDGAATERNGSLVVSCPAFGSLDTAAVAMWLNKNLGAGPDDDHVSAFVVLDRRPSRYLAGSLREVVNSHRNPWVLLERYRVCRRAH